MKSRIHAPGFRCDTAFAALAAAMLACSVEANSGPSAVAGGGGAGGNIDASGSGGQAGGSGGRGLDASADAEARVCDEIINSAPAILDIEPIEPGIARNWWVVNSAGRVDGSVATFMPPASPPAPSATEMDGRAFLHAAGSGLGILDYGLLSYSPLPSALGGEPADFSDGRGLTFDAKGNHLWVVVHTVNTVPRFCICAGDDCFIGYLYEVPVTPNWATYTVTWEEFALPPYVVNRPSLNYSNIVSISFGGIGQDFDVSVDNLKIADRLVPDAGQDGP
jgi:hypothetical protein